MSSNTRSLRGLATGIVPAPSGMTPPGIGTASWGLVLGDIRHLVPRRKT